MALRLFPLIAYLASSAYLVCWLIRLLIVVYQRVRSWANLPRMWLPLKTWGKVAEENGIFVYFIGMLFGGLVTLCLMHIFIQEWLLVIFVVLAVFSDELQISSTETLLLEVMILFNRLAAQTGNNQDVFGVLPSVIEELPEGRARKGALEVVQRRRSGESFEKSLKAMRKIDPLLDEFVLTLQHSGWKNGPGLNIILHRLTGRAGRKWDRASRRLLIKDKIRTYVQFCRGAFIVGLWALIFNSISNLDVVMVDRVVLGLAILALFVQGVLFLVFYAYQRLRLSLAILIFITALISFANSLVVPIPSWIHVETISHHSESNGDTGIIAPQILTVHEENTVLYQVPAAVNDPPIAAVANPPSILTPTAAPTTILYPPCLTTTRVIPMVLDLCLFQSPQPR